MNKQTPTPKEFDAEKFQDIINGLTVNMSELDFEKSCDPIVYDILENYEGFQEVKKGPNFKGTPFDFFAFKNGIPYIIEFKSSLKSFNPPGETQKRRLKEILDRIKGLKVALLQVKLRDGQYRIFYDRDKEYILEKKDVPIEPVVSWIRKHL